MNGKIKKLLENKGDNYIFPFFWQHGEEEEVLREYMEAIYNCGIGAVCVESRPHPDFCGPGWWRDMDIILEEAKKRSMKVWILDDSHFPTGYCNGKMEQEPVILRRQSVTYKIVGEAKSGEEIVLEEALCAEPEPFVPNAYEALRLPDPEIFDDDVFLGLTAVKKGGKSEDDILAFYGPKEKEDNERPKQKEAFGKTGSRFYFHAPKGEWTIYACHLTRNRGPHRNYINMMDAKSCHKLIEAVYEPHYAHYKEEFGGTIAGFFSDEPEIGNGHIYETGKTLEEVADHPWSREVEAELKRRWGAGYRKYLPLLWDRQFEGALKARVRYDFMDVVTRCVEKDFSYQIGDWCRAHGVEYIGHLIEDNNQHSRSGSSLGHFFRGLAGQDMAGIDNIGGQVLPQMEDDSEYCYKNRIRDSVFYHYALGRLAGSAASIEPLKKGRAMCEIFGDYGWAEGVRLEKYLADHFMVRGVNNFVPHAFSPKAFPDSDCPPHFYAHGNNPQYRHFGMLMRYMNRICELISGGRQISHVAVLYHGDADWAGGTCMFSQVPARKLADCQIPYDFVPADIFTEEKYHTVLGKTLRVHRQEYRVLIIPETTYVTAETAKAAAFLAKAGCHVFFINSLPTGICHGNGTLGEGICEAEDRECLRELEYCQVLSDWAIAEKMKFLRMADVQISPEEPLIRVLHYENGSDMFYFVNESAKVYEGTVAINCKGTCYAYNAWDNRLEALRREDGKTKEDCGSGTKLKVHIEPGKSLIVMFDNADREPGEPLDGTSVMPDKKREILLSDGWKRSICSARQYPVFSEEKEVSLPDFVEQERPDFGGYIRYEKELELTGAEGEGKVVLEITDAAEGVEVFVNGISAGIQIVPVYRYDITGFIRKGKNTITVDVATTLERAVQTTTGIPGAVIPPPSNHCGITGNVRLFKTVSAITAAASFDPSGEACCPSSAYNSTSGCSL